MPLIRTAWLVTILLISVSFDAGWTNATDIYVSPGGNDSNTGDASSPVATLRRAQELVRTEAGHENVTVHVADGTYYLAETLVFGPEDSGSVDHPVRFVAQSEHGAIISGGIQLDLDWQSGRDGVFHADTPPGLVIDQLFVDGVNQRMARYPNYDAAKKTAAYQGFSADAFSEQRAAGWNDPTGAYIHAMHRSRWGGYHYRVTGKNADGDVVYEGGWQNNRPSGMHKEYRMIENVFEELDDPGEWYHDADQQRLYFIPSGDTDLSSATVEVVRLRHLIEFTGTQDQPVHDITLSGFTFRHAARTFMQTSEPLLRSDWAIYRGGAVTLTGTESVQILDSEFDQVGGNAIFANHYNRRLVIRGCHIHDTGASGVCFVGDPDAVRDPLFGYGQTNDLAKIDRTPGPKTDNYPADCAVENCLIHGIGRVERQPAGVQIAMARRIRISDCSIYDCARAGINIGDGCWGGHRIERCDVFDTVQETHDHGSFNSWGRDRYWHKDRSESQKFVDAEPDLPFLDAVETTVICNSRWRCDHGWDIDLDDGSSNYDIYNNLMLSGGLKFREGFWRRAHNNIAINNGFHPHVWYNDSGDEVYANIFMAAHRGARTPTLSARGKRIDDNLYFSRTPTMKDRYQSFGWDLNSIVADPQFVDPASGDFRVQPGSPAFSIGFENFPMDQFGVKKESLKRIALTPEIPRLQIRDSLAAPRSDSPKAASQASLVQWYGAKIRKLTGQEFSAFGVSAEDDSWLVLAVKPGSPAATAGLTQDDIVLKVDEASVPNFQASVKSQAWKQRRQHRVGIIRQQQPLSLVLKKP
ncbi:PDZ domain-containing protein [Crateriforma conspicua]|uniref:Uncharacterized protein n=1 Tax=Crateriforma conspicua TaxID=2527996 RepID=A0A5C6FQN3_9PLAN|nr:PDZ domain-containing protein [Crateriforma conspicua]TWU64711.1 hypothetical protein V7x_02550 [Crateriforma conspicua]